MNDLVFRNRLPSNYVNSAPPRFRITSLSCHVRRRGPVMVTTNFVVLVTFDVCEPNTQQLLANVNAPSSNDISNFRNVNVGNSNTNYVALDWQCQTNWRSCNLVKF